MPNEPDAPTTPATITAESPAEMGTSAELPLGQLSLRVLPESVSLPPGPLPSNPAGKPPVSPITRNKILRFADAIEARRDDKQVLAFSPEDFIRFGLPYKRVDGTEYERRNGGMRYVINSLAAYGVPFGQDRLLPIWLATAYLLCGQPEDGVIQFRSVRDILVAFGLPTGGSKHLALKNSLLRLTHATLFVYDERPPNKDEKKRGERVEVRRYNLINKVDLWFNKHATQVNQYTLWQNFITLSQDFAASLRAKVMPVDLATVRALKNNPMALDLYVWQAHRSWELRQKGIKSVGVPVFGPEGLLAQLGSQVLDEAKARQLIRRNQKIVGSVWSGCPNHLTHDGNKLVLRPAEDLKEAKPALPGVSSRPPVSRLRLAAGAPPQQADGEDRLLVERAPA
ncbi:MAG: replication protein RepA [Archangium sp.]